MTDNISLFYQVTQIRVQSFLAFCQIDTDKFASAYESLTVAQNLNDYLLDAKILEKSKLRSKKNRNPSFHSSVRRRTSMKLFSDENDSQDSDMKRLKSLLNQKASEISRRNFFSTNNFLFHNSRILFFLT